MAPAKYQRTTRTKQVVLDWELNSEGNIEQSCRYALFGTDLFLGVIGAVRCFVTHQHELVPNNWHSHMTT